MSVERIKEMMYEMRIAQNILLRKSQVAQNICFLLLRQFKTFIQLEMDCENL